MQKTKQQKNNLHHPASTTLYPSRGFTLVEMLVSIALFSFIMMATTSVLLGVVDANHKAQGLKSTIDNLSLTLESLTRNLRTGTEYAYVTGSGGVDCVSGGGKGIAFTDYNNVHIKYKLHGGSVEMSKDGGVNFTAVTAPEITIDRFCFYIGGIASGDQTQPNVLVTIGGVVSKNTVVGARQRTTSRFDLQTTVTQRVLDVRG